MNQETLLVGLAGVLAAAAPIIFAVLGETFSERAGVINLSMNGTILLSAMGGFAVAYNTDNIVLGFLAGMLIGALVALVVIPILSRILFSFVMILSSVSFLSIICEIISTQILCGLLIFFKNASRIVSSVCVCFLFWRYNS